MKVFFKKIRKYIPFIVVVLVIFFYFNSKTKLTVVVKKISLENRVVKKTVSASGSIKAKQ